MQASYWLRKCSVSTQRSGNGDAGSEGSVAHFASETEAQKDELISYIRPDTLTLRKAATVHGHTVALGASSCL